MRLTYGKGEIINLLSPSTPKSQELTQWAEENNPLNQLSLFAPFVIDFFVFWIFQSWLVPDDMARRQWHDTTILWVVRLVPFVGLVVYLLRRPSLPIDKS
ncbi:hypothetical protein WA1_14410 [Scytonema hofmannii PCC 7110]|uniref:Uncharacterized protein n=1 Tax=Scytonema hofmannii PCC 7110 TaxID=128403 RepID=A0A139XF09_9CYAN|nr:hypothetical protein [Scytonema hofmannii]KYC43280.1 hypothetical protein WA1_14410 [Scytonema hofmannii PCC 7110]